MRAGPRAVAALLVLGGCTGGDGTGRVPPSTAIPGPASTTSTSGSTTSSTTSSTTLPSALPSGAVTLAARELTLPDPRSGGTGLRLLVRPSTPRLAVHRRGGEGAVEACAVTGPGSPVAPGGCTALGPGATVQLASTGGVEVRATGPGATVAEVGVSYVPVDRTTTVVTPARPAGACAATACRVTFSLTPGRAGEFVLEGRAGGGRARLVLESVPSGSTGGSNRVLATVEGGGSLSIRATVEAGREALLLHQEQGPGPVAPVTAEISWP